MKYLFYIFFIIFSTNCFSDGPVNTSTSGSNNNSSSGYINNNNPSTNPYAPTNPTYNPNKYPNNTNSNNSSAKVKIKNKMPACLVGDTLIETIDGLKEIQNINEGEYVSSYNEVTGKIEFKKVLEKIKFKTKYLVRIKIFDEVIETTPNHHFYVMTENGITVLSAMAMAMLPRSTLTDYKLITGPEIYSNEFEAEFLELDKFETVYDLTVEDNHNYRVTSLYLLTHNCTYTLGNGIEKRQFFHHMLLVLDDPRPGHCGEKLRIDFGPHARFSDWDKIKGVFKGYQSADGALIIQTIPGNSYPSFTFRVDDKISLSREQAEEVLRYATKDIKKAIREGKINYFVFNGPHKNDYNCIGLAKMIYKYAEQLK